MTRRTIECLGAVESSQAPVAETIEVYNRWASMGRRRSAWCSLTGSEAPKWTHREKGDVDGFPRTSGASEVDSSMPPANWINKGKLIGRALNLVLGRLQHDLPTCRNGKRQLQDGESVSTFNIEQSLHLLSWYRTLFEWVQSKGIRGTCCRRSGRRRLGPIEINW